MACTTIVLPVVLLSLSQAPADPKALDGLTVHEWGTFTSIAGEDGMAVEAAVRDAIARRDVTAIRKYSRFVDAIASRILERSTPVERARALALIQRSQASWTPPRASCE